MSYSFSVTAPTKGEAKERVAEEMDKVVKSQPTHAADRDAAVETAGTFIDMLVDDEDRDVGVTVNGYMQWQAEGEFIGASVGVTASLKVRIPAA